MLVCGWNFPYFQVNWVDYDYKSDEPIILKLSLNSYSWSYSKFSLESGNQIDQYQMFCEKNIQNKHEGNKTKTKSIKLKLMKRLNMNQFWASWSSDFLLRGLSLEN